MKKWVAIMLIGIVALMSITGCSAPAGVSSADEEIVLVEILDGEVPLYAKPATSTVLTPTSPKTTAYNNNKVTVDASNASEGYLAITYTGSNPRIKVQITKDGGTTYTYDLNARNTFEVFPLSEGNGNYAVAVFENASGNSYSQAFYQNISVNLKNNYTAFLYPNQYVNFNSGSQVVKTGEQITQGLTEELQVVDAIYNYVIKEFAYDYGKAGSVQSGYLPSVDKVLAEKKGICFDYAAVMASMLRSQNIPTKLVVGYTNQQYHAWIDVYVENTGWVSSVIYFDGSNWSLMDPTFASTGGSNSADYITNPANYVGLYVY